MEASGKTSARSLLTQPLAAHRSERQVRAVQAQSGSHLVMEECRLLRNNTYGACAVGASTLICTACRTENNGGAGFVAAGGSIFKLTECVSEGDRTGVKILSAGCELDRVTVKGCAVTGFSISNAQKKAVLNMCNATVHDSGMRLPLRVWGSGCEVAVSDSIFDQPQDKAATDKHCMRLSV